MATYTDPHLGIETEVLLKKEGTPGTQEAMTAGSEHLDLVSEGLDYVPVLSSYPAIAGDRQRWAGAEHVSHNDGGGSIVCRPRSAQLDNLIELILGGASPLLTDATELDRFTVEVTKAGEDTLALVGCKVNTATFRSSANEPLELELNVIASSGVRGGAHTAWVSTQVDAEKPFMHGGLVMSGDEAWLKGADDSFNVEIRSIEFTLNNNLDADAYCNSTDRRLIPLGLFTMEGSMEIPYNAVTSGFWTEMVNAAKVKFTATWTDADTNTFVAAFVVKIDGELPKISGPEQVWLSLNFHGVADLADTVCITLTSTE